MLFLNCCNVLSCSFWTPAWQSLLVMGLSVSSAAPGGHLTPGFQHQLLLCCLHHSVQLLLGRTEAHPQALAAWPPGVRMHVGGLEETPALPRVVGLCSAFSDITLAIGLGLAEVKVEAPQAAFACRDWDRTVCCAVLLQ